jgi:hypothetical protein
MCAMGPQGDHHPMSPHAFRYEDCTIPEGMTVEEWRAERRRRAAERCAPQPRWRRALRLGRRAG